MQISTQLTRGSCVNVGGYFDSAVNSTVTEATRRGRSSTAGDPLSTAAVPGRCYYETFDCGGVEHGGQCYSGRSSSMSCPSCRNIGGQFATGSGCYYYSTDCGGHLSAGDQCHTDRCCMWDVSEICWRGCLWV